MSIEGRTGKGTLTLSLGSLSLFGLVRLEPFDVERRQQLLPLDGIGQALCDQHRRRVQVPARHAREDAGVHDAEVLAPEHLADSEIHPVCWQSDDGKAEFHELKKLLSMKELGAAEDYGMAKVSLRPHPPCVPSISAGAPSELPAGDPL